MWPVTIALVAALLLGERIGALILLVCGLTLDLLLRMGTARCRRVTHELLRQLGPTVETERPQFRHASIESTTNQLAASLACGAVAATGLTFAITRNAEAALSVMIVAGVAGVVLGPPIAIRGAIGRAAQGGVFIRDSVCLERLWRLDTVVLDHPTVMSGELRVHAVYPATGVVDAELLEIAAMAESRSDHAIGRAIVEHASRRGIAIRESDRFAASPGQGVSVRCDGERVLVGTGKFVTDGRFLEPQEEHSPTVYVTRGGQYLGAIAVSSCVRPEVKHALAELKALGIQAHLSTSGGTPGIAGVTRNSSVDAYETGLLPGLNLERITMLARQGRVAVVGSALGHAPRPSPIVGVTLEGAADMTHTNPDVLLMDNDLMRLVAAVRLARQAHRVILANIAGTIGIAILGIATVSAGLLTPLAAALINVSSSYVFTVNAARLIPSEAPPRTAEKREAGVASPR